MRFSDIYRSRPFGLSFELFPPKSESGLEALMNHVQALMRHKPGFITCTYGAGGSTRERTLEIVSTVRQRFQLPVASHLTCVGATVDQLRSYLAQARERGVDNIVALRGDPPRGEASFSQVPGGLRYANELVSVIRDEFPDFGIAVAGYPEKHQEAPNMEVDVANLCRKVDAGAEVVITQLFFNNDDFLSFRDRCERLGVRVPIIPGLLPVTNLSQIQRITSLCGARLPRRFVERLAEHDDEAWQFEVGVQFAVEQLRQLLDHGVRGVHFYVLNKSQATCRVLESVLPLAEDPVGR
jgi:methylenetetrahydrofolate reductase (NADPH)